MLPPTDNFLRMAKAQSMPLLLTPYCISSINGLHYELLVKSGHLLLCQVVSCEYVRARNYSKLSYEILQNTVGL